MKQIIKTFKTPAGEFTALKGITVCFYRGEFVSVVGKSGSGKSTLANMITGIDRPTSGTVSIAGTQVHGLSESERSQWRGRNLGIVFQFFQLLPMLSLLENVVLPMDFCRMFSPDEREERAMALLDLVGLADLADKLPSEVSGGQQQSAAIARALANDPPVLIADEPTGNLDSRTADAVFEIFTDLVRKGKTILMVTHDSGLARRTDRAMLLSDGELVNDWVARALGDLSPRRLLWLTHNMTTQVYAPGEPIPLPGQSQNGLYLVTSGRIQFALGGSHRNGTGLNPGEYLSSLDLEAVSGRLSGLYAGSEAPVELLKLDQAAWQNWLDESKNSRRTLESHAHSLVGRLQP